MTKFLHPIWRILGSLGLSCVLLLLLALLTWLGTLAQVEDGLYIAQKKYFESYFLVHRLGSVPIPLPGANLVLWVLFLNLTVGGLIRLARRGWSVAGVLVTHVGIILLLLAAFVKLHYSEDGHITLYENESSSEFQSYYRWEIAIKEERPDGTLLERVVPQEDFLDATGTRKARLTSPELPFELELGPFFANCQPMPKGPMFTVDVPVVDGAFLRERPMPKEAENAAAGIYARALVDGGEGAAGPTQEGILWGFDRAPWTVQAGGKRYAIDLRHERYAMPFTIRLDDFKKVDHPGITMAKSFSSDVTVVENGSTRPVVISMNEPLRDRGLVLYQASWGPSDARPGEPLFSTFSVVRNPADYYPLYACIVIAIGLVLHFSRKLTRYVRSEARQTS